jgi:opacity protein-like surface antigen
MKSQIFDTPEPLDLSYTLIMMRLWITITVLLITTFVLRAQAVEFADEAPYLPQKTKIKIQKPKTESLDESDSVFDEVRIHAGAAFVNSFQDYVIAPGIRERGGIKGFDLNFGVDLFSEHWQAEGHLVNFPETGVSDTRISSNGFELRLIYDTAIFEGITVHGGAGVANRSYTIKTSTRPDHSVLRGENSFSSGASVLTAGLDYWPNGQISAGLELSNHLPMASGDDPTSMDLAIKVNGHF